MKKKLLNPFILTALLTLGSHFASHAQSQLNVLKIKTAKDLHAYFQYTGNDPILIAGHRGGMVKGFPENSIATFENTLKHTPAFFEIDPRLTKDSVIVLMHDATLDRTTTGKGKLSDYTYEELKKFRLKDAEGNVTNFPIPTLSEVIEWARGKTVLNLDRKDVPLAMTAALIKKHKADAFVMLTVHSAAEMTYYLSQNKNHTFSAFIRNMKEYEDYEKANVPFTQMIAYIGPHVKPENKELYALLNKKGTMCMISAASSYDKLKTAEERKAAYLAIAKDGASILESDLPIEAAEAVKEYVEKKGTKQRFFGKK
ncbi:glycerophosphoryl diester phosphodiesterase [Dyadobacter sp. BE34]|uniref:Glycerophosphoryl diester phosphodiesterase n=1 Tax=Dyadobacter fermentans TaxID=94254 RepID=A0ABU1R4J1_9BACT|nr:MULTISPECIES: glycerophosphodiester phosphodiesterase family protein [Dyadobacter]MDR6808318.1 glycerophosphoryl diester phosphodiesterase [Dyadobacter fermentans]MDR7045866.1 glycerophosphoryl diester phosphodiesterase [Dyadobacter sp. BE242]MDR7200179.1 glycerophosphoryl diester phosphodiesterase [Dyadobacter sp. BE34]MDR7218139.1 glycerophosphoryl diester phosphodiesterase [Dyadobacter sp. BE31]MDR7266070.1 glycerophosphoryl diester phosphodiesterase [Dyadobacter sp. BE32]